MISVCIPTYNGGKFIRLQLESILSQLSNDDEVIISDDSSSDNTLEIINSFQDKRIRVFSNNTFHSPIYNLENALKQAKGDYIFLSDQDDEWKLNKVTVVMEHLKNAELVVHDAEVVDGERNLSFNSFYELNHTKYGKFYNLLKNGYVGCCMAFNRHVLEACLPFPKNIPMHDLWIGNVAAFNCGRVLFIKDKLLSYRRHGNNASITGEKSHRSIYARISDRLSIIQNILRLRRNIKEKK